MRRLLLWMLPWLAPGAGLALDEVERFQLPNGLIVLVGVERRLPLVNVTCLYRVGSANERPGITGIAHYVEHMAFRATEHISHADVTGTIERIGGRWNGYTWIDQTLYAATVPSWALESVLHIEAERMSRVLFDPEAFARERTSVIAELQGYENDPASILRDLAVATSFEIHPYRYNVIGWLTDVLAIEREQALDFYKDFYGPNHATLSVVGDVDPEVVRGLVERYFASLSPSRRSAEVRVIEPVQKGEKLVTLRHPGSVSHLLLVFRAPAATAADFPTLLVTDALLAGGRGLLFGGREASPESLLAEAFETSGGFGASTNLTASRSPFVYEIGGAASSPEKLASLETTLWTLLDRLRKDGPTPAQLETARLQLRAGAAYESTTLAEIAHRLSYYEALGSWRRANEILTSIDTVTAEDVRRFAGTYLTPARGTVARHIPGEVEEAVTVSVPSAEAGELPAAEASVLPRRALEPVDLPAIPRAREVLTNGVTVLAAQREGSSAFLRSRLGFGSLLDPPGKQGLAFLTARLVLNDAELAASLGRLGARWSTSATDAPTYSNRAFFDLEVQFFPESEGTVIEAVGRALSKREWTETDIERVKEELLDDIASLETDAVWLAEKQAMERVDSRWRPPTGSTASIHSITAADVRSFLSRAGLGGAVTTAVVSPSPPEESLSVLARAFHSIPPGEASLVSEANRKTSRPGEAQTALPGKSQAEIVAALPTVPRDHPDALPLRLLSYVLGETGYAGRLGDLLVDSGLAYSVYTLPQWGKTDGLVLIETGTAPSNLDKVLTVLRRVLGDLSTRGVTESEWNEARAFRVGRLVLGLDSPVDLSRALVDSELFGEDLLDVSARSKEILAISRDRLNAIARRYLRPELLAVGVAGALPE